jgi:hypothetical protein
MSTTVQGTLDNGPTYEVTAITPAMAKEWLQRNTHNRNLRERVVNGYATDMASGAWLEDGQSIKFAADGTLLDGQHRLAAIVQSGVTIRLLVVRDLPNHTQDTMDTGAKRTMADVLKLRGEAHVVILAAALLRVAKWKQGYRKNLKRGGNATVTNRQLLEILNEHPELRRSAEIAERVRSVIALNGSTAALCHWLFNSIDKSDCAYFFARLGDGVGLDGEDPIYALRRALANLANQQGRPDETHVNALVIKAWNLFREGKTVQILVWRAGGAKPEPFPEPK